MPVRDGRHPEVGVRTPGGLDPRPPHRPATVQTALPQSPPVPVPVPERDGATCNHPGRIDVHVWGSAWGAVPDQGMTAQADGWMRVRTTWMQSTMT